MNKKKVLIIIAVSLFVLSVEVFASEPLNNFKLEIKPQKTLIPPPIYNNNRAYAGEELLLVQVFERQGLWDDLSRTKFYMLNPEEKKIGFKKIFEGPGEDQYFHFLTSLFNGWGIADGTVNEKFERQWPELFWFNAVTGNKGPIINKGSYGEFIFKDYLIFFTGEGLNRYHIKSGELVHIPIKSFGRVAPATGCRCCEATRGQG